MQQTVISNGEWIVHTRYGIGQVTGKVKKTLNGENQSFYKVKIKDGMYWLPVINQQPEHIRRLASIKEIEKALKILQTKPEVLPDKYKDRVKFINDVIKDNTLDNTARMIRDLHGKKLDSHLSITEEDAYIKLKERFVKEWELISDSETKNLEMKLNEFLQK